MVTMTQIGLPSKEVKLGKSRVLQQAGTQKRSV